jgi:hypothetical protein
MNHLQSLIFTPSLLNIVPTIVGSEISTPLLQSIDAWLKGIDAFQAKIPPDLNGASDRTIRLQDGPSNLCQPTRPILLFPVSPPFGLNVVANAVSPNTGIY